MHRPAHIDSNSPIRISVVIPTLNESANMPHILPRIPTWVDEILLVDGHSTDGTVEVARKVLPRIRVIPQEGKGKGAALRTGILAATGDFIITMDSDGSNEPEEIPAFVGALLSGADYVKGSRFLQGAGTVDMPFQRRLGNKCLVTLANFLFKTHFTDITCGFNGVRREHREKLALEIDGWAHEIVSNVRCAWIGLRVVEVACYESERIAGVAKLQALPAGWTILKGILKERFGRRDRRQKWVLTQPASPTRQLGSGVSWPIMSGNNFSVGVRLSRNVDHRIPLS